MIRSLMEDSKIPNIYSTGLYSEKGYDIAWEHTNKILDIIINGVTECLADIKSKDYPVVFMFKEGEKNFIAAAILEYYPNEDDPNRPGNWNYSWTFNEGDIPENAMIKTPYDNKLASYFRSVGMNKYGMEFEKVEWLGDCTVYLLKVIKKWLDDNASENEENGVKIDGLVQFRVAVENGEKVTSIEVDGEIKQLIKDDSAIEA